MTCSIDCSYIFNQLCKKLDKLENYLDNILINCFKIKKNKGYQTVTELEEVTVIKKEDEISIDNEDYTLL
jgi:hypothetical protein